MKITSVANPFYSKADNSMIDCVITCEKGTFPFTATPHDSEAHGRQLYADLIAGKHGSITSYTPK